MNDVEPGACMIQHNDLPTLLVRTRWDDVFYSSLLAVAVFSYQNGEFEGLIDEALHLLEAFRDEDSSLFRPLKNAFNAWMLASRVAEFDLDDAEADQILFDAEATLAKEVIAFSADPDVYVIVHAVDDEDGDESWLLCYVNDVQELESRGLRVERPLSA